MAQVLGTGTQRAGKTSVVKIGVNQLAMKRFDATWDGDDIDTVNFTSGGYDEGILGIQSLKWMFGGDWDANFNQFGDPPGVYPRDDLTSLVFEYSTIDTVGINLPYARVRTAKVGTQVKEAVSIESSGFNQGPFTVETSSGG